MVRFWLIRRQPYRETSVLATVLTEHDQLLRGVIRGGISRSEFELCEGSLTGHGLLGIEKVAPLSARLPLSGMHLISALYVNEVMYHLIPDGGTCAGLFQSYTACLSSLLADAPGPALRAFECHLLADLGLYLSAPPSLTDESDERPRYYRCGVDGQLIEVQADDPDAVAARQWSALLNQRWSDVPMHFATGVHRVLMDRALGGRWLVSRELLTEWKKTR